MGFRLSYRRGNKTAKSLLSGEPQCLLKWRVNEKEYGSFSIDFVIISKDRRLALVVKRTKNPGLPQSTSPQVGSLSLWNLETRRLNYFFGGLNPIESAVLSDDGCWALCRECDSKTRKLFELNKQQTICVFADSSVGQTTWRSDDENWELYISKDKTLHLRSVTTGRAISAFSGTSETRKPPNRDDVWFEVVPDSLTNVFRRCKILFNLGTVSGNQRWAMTISSDDHHPVFWDVNQTYCVRTLDAAFLGRMSYVDYLSEDGTLAVFCGDCNFELWDLKMLVTQPFQSPFVLCNLITTDTASFANSEFTRLITQGEKSVRDRDWKVALSCVNEARQIPGYEAEAKIIDLAGKTGRHCFRLNFYKSWFRHSFIASVNIFHKIHICADRNQIFYRNEKVYHLRELTTGECLFTFDVDAGVYSAECVSPDGCFALIKNFRRDFQLWDLRSGDCIQSWNSDTEHRTLCISPDNRLALSVDYDSLAHIWDLSTGVCLRQIGHPQRVKAAGFCPDGRTYFVATCSSIETLLHVIEFWDIQSGRYLREINCGTPVYSCYVSSDTILVLTDLGIRILDATTGKCVKTFGKEIGSPVCQSADQCWILTGVERTNIVKLWNRKTGECVRTLEGQSVNGGLGSISLSCDGRWAVAGTSETVGTLRVWELDWEYEYRAPQEWDEGARVYLQNFLTIHTPYEAELPATGEPTEEEITLALSRKGRPTWKETDFDRFMDTLAYAGFGWLRKEGVRSELEKMSKNWQGPPPLPN